MESSDSISWLVFKNVGANLFNNACNVISSIQGFRLGASLGELLLLELVD
jgi:hypothetical protein